MNSTDIILKRVNYLIELTDKCMKSAYSSHNGLYTETWVNNEIFKELESSSLSFIINLYGEKHPYFETFKKNANNPKPEYVQAGRGILNSIKTEIEMGWLTTVKGLVTAEIFTDFIETAEYLLEQKYKDPAAVIIGSVLEEHLRQLCRKFNLSVEENKNGKTSFKKADTLNGELGNAGIYNKLDQKNITAWFDLRNKAAHGNYSEYTIEQVHILLNGVMDFLSRNSI